jgi:hypothetical protein
MVAGGRYELYSAYPIRVSAFRPLLQRNETLCDGLHQGAESISRWPFTAGNSRRRPAVEGPPVAPTWENAALQQ